MSWYYIKNGCTFGPVTLAEIGSAMSSGAVLSSDLVWSEGMTAWAEAGSLPALSRRTPPPLPVPPSSEARLADDRFVRWLLPVGRSGWAIASGYLGFFALIPLAGPLALITGVLGVRDITSRRGVHGMGRCVFGIVMGLLGTVFYAGLLISGMLR